jgi:hypothetical protein
MAQAAIPVILRVPWQVHSMFIRGNPDIRFSGLSDAELNCYPAFTINQSGIILRNHAISRHLFVMYATLLRLRMAV